MKQSPKTISSSVDEYVAAFPKEMKLLLNDIRKTIKAAAPEAEEVISYGMPGYKYHGMLVYFAAWKNHIGFYPAGVLNAFKKELAVYELSKGTIRFPLDKPLPSALISKIVKFRVKENEERAAAKKHIKPEVKKTRSTKPADEEQVNAWMDRVDSITKAEIETVRKIIKTASAKLSERIKWNAPSYYYKEDIVTFGPYKTHKLLLVFHHPSVVKVKSELLEGDHKDRRLVYFKDKAEAEKNKKELVRIIKEIIKAIDNK